MYVPPIMQQQKRADTYTWVSAHSRMITQGCRSGFGTLRTGRVLIGSSVPADIVVTQHIFNMVWQKALHLDRICSWHKLSCKTHAGLQNRGSASVLYTRCIFCLGALCAIVGKV